MAYSSAEPTVMFFVAYGGTMLPTLRTTKRWPGAAPVISSGITRESEHDTMSVSGRCPSSASWRRYSFSAFAKVSTKC